MDQIFYNGTFLTMDEAYENPESVLVRNGKIEAAGGLREVRELSPLADLRDMERRTVLPGFIDGHSHLSAAAYQLRIANLKPSPLGPCNSVEAVVRELKKALEEKRPEKGRWLIGLGYDNSVFPGGRHPTREDLDQVSREIPIAATHVSGHLCVVNTRGMELFGYLDGSVPVPEGGIAKPWGLLKEQAFLDRTDVVKGPLSGEILEAVGEASLMYASYGLTTVQDGKVTEELYQLLRAAAGKGLLKNDVVMYLTPELAGAYLPVRSPEELAAEGYDNHLRPAGVKLFLDGSPQGKTAWLSQPYYQIPEGEKPDYRGFSVQTEEYVMAAMKKCVKNQWQLNVHANGDEAIEQMLRCYGRTVNEMGAGSKLRPVIIHCQTVREDQLRRMKALGMLASFFLDHVYYWGDYHYDSVLGPERAQRISPARWAVDYGISFTLHQDTPVAPPAVMGAIHNAVNRMTAKGRLLGAEQRITVTEALRAVTINGAYQIFEENRKGSITPGKAADFTVLGENPLKVPKDRLKDIPVLETIKAGETIFCSR